MLRCAITDGTWLADDPASQRSRLLEQARRWAASGIELVQLREKHLDAGALFSLAEAMMQALRSNASSTKLHASSTKLLINSRADVAIAVGADGVHLTSQSGELTPPQVRAVFAHAHRPVPIVSVSCHTLDEVARARDNGVDYILFGPVFEKRLGDTVVQNGVGLDRLRKACELAQPIPVLALGGVNETNTTLCLDAAAAGIAAIRLFR